MNKLGNMPNDMITQYFSVVFLLLATIAPTSFASFPNCLDLLSKQDKRWFRAWESLTEIGDVPIANLYLGNLIQLAETGGISVVTLLEDGRTSTLVQVKFQTRDSIAWVGNVRFDLYQADLEQAIAEAHRGPQFGGLSKIDLNHPVNFAQAIPIGIPKYRNEQLIDSYTTNSTGQFRIPKEIVRAVNPRTEIHFLRFKARG